MPTGETPSYNISVRFGDEIMQAGFTAVPNLLLNHYAELGISPTEMVFIVHIWQYWWTDRDPYPALKSIADKMGTSLRQARRYAESLKDKQLLKVRERRMPELGQVTNEYDFSPLLRALLALSSSEPHHAVTARTTPRTHMTGGGVSKMSGGPRSPMSAEEDEEQEDPDQEDESLISNGKAINTEHKIMDQLLVTALRQEIVENSAGRHAGQESAARPAGWSSVSQVLSRTQPRRGASGGSTKNAGRGRPPKAPPYIAAVLDDVSTKLHDENPHSSLTRATRLWQASGLAEPDFVQRLYEARSITQQQGNVKKRATDGYGTINRMPYFFSVVEDLLGLRDAPGDERSGPGGRHAPQRR